MEKLIKKYIDRIKVDYPEDDKLMIDLQDFYKEAQSQALTKADVSGRSEQLKCKNPNPPCSPNLKYGMLECCECDWSE